MEAICFCESSSVVHEAIKAQASKGLETPVKQAG